MVRRDRQHVAQIRGAILVRGRTDGNELEQAVLDALGGVRRELQAPGLGIALDQHSARLVDRDLARR